LLLFAPRWGEALSPNCVSAIGRPVGDHGSSASDACCLVSTCPDSRVNVYQMGEPARLSFVAGAGLPVRHVS
jgi:hypothetical protein